MDFGTTLFVSLLTSAGIIFLCLMIRSVFMEYAWKKNYEMCNRCHEVNVKRLNELTPEQRAQEIIDVVKYLYGDAATKDLILFVGNYTKLKKRKS